MANKRVTELTQDTTPARTDLLYKVDAAGTVDRSVSFADLLKLAQAADVSGLGSFALLSSLAHSATTGITTDDHHAKSHAHDGGDGSGTIAYSSLTGAPGLGDVRTISVDTTLAADNSWTPVDYFEIASNVALELASGAVVEVLS